MEITDLYKTVWGELNTYFLIEGDEDLSVDTEYIQDNGSLQKIDQKFKKEKDDIHYSTDLICHSNTIFVNPNIPHQINTYETITINCFNCNIIICL